jgi:aldose 1-epimerase
MTILSLRTDRLGLDLAPAAGGSMARFTIDGWDVLRRMTSEAVDSGKGNNSACYPLVPYSGRMANGRLSFNGMEIVLPPNWAGSRHPMHGDSWAQPWDVARQDASSAELVYSHDGRSGWPFRYRARQTFRLEDERLTVTMALDNLERKEVPGGMGLHPFFARDAETELTCHPAAVWLTDAEVLPTERVAVSPEWDFSKPRKVDKVVLDNCFEDWDGKATLVWPNRRLRLDLTASPPFRHLVIYAPPRQPFFCVEPVSHTNGKVGETRLAPGATLAGEIVFHLSDL